ncbi:carboxypeptidase-like regulatory domain-containing protein [Carboxydochorda subterranea]|uniref:Carboxypeptidase-like regulatory domain-containing protein n=1 Tax=Carboxydichorda subterranea TaxID=3109565 RepID=A0ABZ1BZD4_9FIRM|nr:carboxypeptidase-like regulatory domain-containing protein [Limnochorda sp. L945t]WRP17866.1 carboxypeptidase-like regulatory domain-containing protein [Limnochorda sp. L945t]
MLLPADPVRPGTGAVVGHVGFLVPKGLVSIIPEPQAPALVSQGPEGTFRLPLNRLQWGLRWYEGQVPDFTPLTYPGTGRQVNVPAETVAHIEWRFRPEWTDRAASAPYSVPVRYTLQPSGVTLDPVLAWPNPYVKGSTQPLQVYADVPGQGAIWVRLGPAAPGTHCSVLTPWDVLAGPVGSGWQMLEVPASKVTGLPVGLYCVVVDFWQRGQARRRIGGTTVLLVESGAVAQALEVQVRDAADGRPVNGALVTLRRPGGPPGRSGRSNGQGSLTFSGLDAGVYRVEAEAPGYRRAAGEVRVPPADARVQSAAKAELLLRPADTPSIRLAMRNLAGRRALWVGDVVEIDASVEFARGLPDLVPGGEPSVLVELRFPSGLQVLPDSWRPSPGGDEDHRRQTIGWSEGRLLWQVGVPRGSATSSLSVRAMVTPEAAGRGEVEVIARGTMRYGRFEASLAPASTSLPLSRELVDGHGVVVGRVEPASGQDEWVVASSLGVSARVDRSGFFRMALPAGVHMLWVERPAAARGDHEPVRIPRGEPAILVVRPGVSAPAVLAAPSPGARPAGGSPAWRVDAAGRMEWTSGAAPDGNGSLLVTVGAGEARGQLVVAAGPDGRLPARLEWGTALHEVTAGLLDPARGDRVQPPAVDGRLLQPPSSDTGDGGGLVPGVAWEWEAGDARGSGLVATWRLDGGQSFVQAVDRRDEKQTTWLTVTGPMASGQGGQGPALHAGWRRSDEDKSEAQVEYRMSLDPGRPMDPAGYPVPVDGLPPSAWTARLVTPWAGGRDTAWQTWEAGGETGLAGPGAGGGRTTVEWSAARLATGGLAHRLGLGADMGRFTQLYGMGSLLWHSADDARDPARLRQALAVTATPEGSSLPSSLAGAVRLDARAGLAVGQGDGGCEAVPRVYPVARLTAAAAGPAAPRGRWSLGVDARTLHEGQGGAPATAWIDLAASLSRKLDLRVQGRVEATFSAYGLRLTPGTRVEGALQPSSGVRLATGLEARPERLRPSHLAIEYNPRWGTVALRLTPEQAELSWTRAGPAPEETGATGAVKRWSGAFSLRRRSGGAVEPDPTALVAEGRLLYGSERMAASVCARFEGEVAEWSASIGDHPGPSSEAGRWLRASPGRYLRGDVRVTPAGEGYRAWTWMGHAGIRGLLAERWGWFAEGGAASLTLEPGGWSLHRSASFGAGLFVVSRESLLEMGWRLVKAPGEPMRPGDLPASMRPGLFVRTTGWWSSDPGGAGGR